MQLIGASFGARAKSLVTLLLVLSGSMSSAFGEVTHGRWLVSPTNLGEQKGQDTMRIDAGWSPTVNGVVEIPDRAGKVYAEISESRLKTLVGFYRSMTRADRPGHQCLRVKIDDALNAFADPTTRCIEFTVQMLIDASDDVLAFIMGHEIGHLHFGHGDPSESRLKKGEQIAERLEGLSSLRGHKGLSSLKDRLPSSSPLGGRDRVVGQGTAASGFSRQQEYEADAFGVELLRAIGFDQARIDRAAVGIYHLLGGATPIDGLTKGFWGVTPRGSTGRHA